MGGGVTWVETTVSPSNRPSRALFESLARRLDTALEEEPCFGEELFPPDGHEAEPRLPTLGDGVGTHAVVIGLSPVEAVEPRLLLVVAALDNLLKGAASQAVQNANLMFGLDERTGLDPWV